MKNLEIKKNKGLKLNFTLLILFAIHLFSILIAFKTKDFQSNKYPLARILDSYLAISLFFNPIALSSLVKKVIEIEEKNNMWLLQISLGLKVQKILLDKIKNLSIKVFLLQIFEWLIIIFLASKNINFDLDINLIKRIIIYFLTTLSINISMIMIFTIIEIKSKKIYFSLFNCWSNVGNNYYVNIKSFIANKSLWTLRQYFKYKLCKRWTSFYTDYE